MFDSYKQMKYTDKVKKNTVRKNMLKRITGISGKIQITSSYRLEYNPGDM